MPVAPTCSCFNIQGQIRCSAWAGDENHGSREIKKYGFVQATDYTLWGCTAYNKCFTWSSLHQETDKQWTVLKSNNTQIWTWRPKVKDLVAPNGKQANAYCKRFFFFLIGHLISHLSYTSSNVSVKWPNPQQIYILGFRCHNMAASLQIQFIFND